MAIASDTSNKLQNYVNSCLDLSSHSRLCEEGSGDSQEELKSCLVFRLTRALGGTLHHKYLGGGRKPRMKSQSSLSRTHQDPESSRILAHWIDMKALHMGMRIFFNKGTGWGI